MNEEQILKKTEKMRKIFGASDEDTREAIRKAKKDQQRRGLSAAEVEMEKPFVKNAVWVLEKYAGGLYCGRHLVLEYHDAR